MKNIVLTLAVVLVLAVCLTVAAQNNHLFRAHDPGPRPNPQSPVPSPVAGLNANETCVVQ